MAPVADTRTQTDAHLEQRQIREGNALLIQERDTLLREVAQLQASAASMRAVLNATHGAELTSREFADKMSAQLLADRDQLRKDVDALGQEKDARTVRVKALDTDIAGKETRVADLNKQIADNDAVTQKKRNESQAAILEHALIVEGHQGEIGAIHGQIAGARSELAAVQKETDEKKGWLLGEARRLEVKERDLAIYESRIRSAAAQLTPPMDIII